MTSIKTFKRDQEALAAKRRPAPSATLGSQETGVSTIDKPQTGLVITDPLTTALVEASTPEAIQQVRSMAEAALKWAKVRGLGIADENKAAEVILRAERKLGEHIRELAPKAGAQPGSRHHVPAGHEVIRPGGVLDKLIEDGVIANKKQAMLFQLAAAVPEDTFEAMLTEVRGNVERIAKVNFYRAGRQARGLRDDRRVTAEDSGFLQLRAGAHALLGWVVDQEGAGHATENRLTQLPADELRQVAGLIKALAAAYNEAKATR